jgi:hypothetical protein
MSSSSSSCSRLRGFSGRLFKYLRDHEVGPIPAMVEMMFERCEVTSELVVTLILDRRVRAEIRHEMVMPLLLSKFNECTAVIENFEMFLFSIILNNPKNSGIVENSFKFQPLPKLVGVYLPELLSRLSARRASFTIVEVIAQMVEFFPSLLFSSLLFSSLFFSSAPGPPAFPRWTIISCR